MIADLVEDKKNCSLLECSGSTGRFHFILPFLWLKHQMLDRIRQQFELECKKIALGNICIALKMLLEPDIQTVVLI